MTVIIHKTRPDWAQPLGTIIFVPFKTNKKTDKEQDQSENQVKNLDKQNRAADKKLSSVISMESNDE
jgi:hypothetical protein